MHVEATFFFVCIFPPPSSGAKVFAGSDGACTGCAADADKAFVVQRIIRYVELFDVVACLLGGPVEQGVEFDHLIGFVPFNGRQVFSGRGMFCTEAGDPYFVTCEGALEGLYFSDEAAGLAEVY